MEALDDHEYSGGLISLLNAAKSFIVANTKMMWRKTNDGRMEYPEYPERAYEEGLVNALIHRDYLEIGSEVHIDIYDDRMEIVSPGGMPSGKRVQELDLRQVSSMRRNPVIADLFQRLDLMERRGSGFKKILDAYAFESEKRGETIKPRFESTSTDFFLILPNLNYGRVINGVATSSEGQDAETTQNATEGNSSLVNEKVNEKVNERQKKIISVVSSNPYVTQSELAGTLGISLVHVNKNMKKLQGLGLIRRVGPDKGGHWEVVG